MNEQEQLRLLRTPFGLEQRASCVHLDRVHEEIEEDVLLPSAFAPLLVAAGRRSTAAAGTARSGIAETAAGEAERGVETAVLPTVLIVGDQNAGKTSFLYCFSRNLFVQQLQLSSFLPLLRASFLNARLLFLSKQQLHRMQQAAAATTPQLERRAATTAAKSSLATLETAAGATATCRRGASAAAGGEPAAEAAAAATTAARQRMSPLSTCMGRAESEPAEGREYFEGERGEKRDINTSERRAKGTGNKESDGDEAEDDALLSLARDELPFLDSDIARALILFTLEDFIFFCSEFHVPFSSNKSSNDGCESNSSIRSSEGNAAATWLNALQAAGTRYVAVHLLEFGGDQLDRLLRFYQLTGRHHSGIDHEYSSSSRKTHSRAEECSSTSSAKARATGTSSSNESKGRMGSNSTTSGNYGRGNSSSSNPAESPACRCGLKSSDRPSAGYEDELHHWQIIMGKGSAAENTVAAAAAGKLLRDEQQRFEEALVARATHRTGAAAGGGSSRVDSAAVAVPHLAARSLPCASSAARGAGVSRASAAASGAPAACAAGVGGRRNASSAADAVAGTMTPETASCPRLVPTAAAAPAADKRDTGAQSAAEHVTAAGDRDAGGDTEEGDAGAEDAPSSAIAAGTCHGQTRAREAAVAAANIQEAGAAGDREDCSSNSRKLLQVLRQSAQLLSDTTHILYFLNCSSLMPTLLAPCSRACCCVSGAQTPELCFTIDPTAFSACLGRLRTIALVKWHSTLPREGSSTSRCGRGHTTSKRSNRSRCASSSSNNCSSSNSCSSSSNSATPETPLKEPQEISFICCRLPSLQPFPFFASTLISAPRNSTATADAAATQAEASEKELLGRCCSCCMRENFKVAMQVLQPFYAKQQQRQQYQEVFLQRHSEQLSNVHPLTFADGGTGVGGASRAAAAAASFPPATGRAPTGSGDITTCTSPHSRGLQVGEGAATVPAAVSETSRTFAAAYESTDTREKKGETGCYHVASPAEHEEECNGFTLFKRLLQEAAAAAVAAARSAEPPEEEELASAAAEEIALRGSPRFLFIHALLHFMWARHAAGESDAPAATPGRSEDAVHQLPVARAVPVEAAEAAPVIRDKEREVPEVAEVEVSFQCRTAEEPAAASGEAAEDRREAAVHAASAGDADAAEIFGKSDAAGGRASRETGERTDCMRHVGGRRRDAASGEAGSTAVLLSHNPSRLQQICSRLQLAMVYPVQLLDVEGEQQQQWRQSAPVLERLEQQQQRQLGIWEEDYPRRLAQQQLQQQQSDLVREEQQKPMQQQEVEVLPNNVQQEEEEEEHGQEQKKSSVLLQPPFRVGAVVNLFAALLRLTQQQKHINQDVFPIGTEIQETEAGAEAAALFGADARQLPSTRIPLAVAAREEERTCVSVAEQQEAAAHADSSSTLTERIPTTDEVPVKVEKGRASRTSAADVAAGPLKAPTGELGRQLLLILLRLVKKRRHLVRLCSAEGSDEAEAAALSESLALGEGASGSSSSGNVLLNCWFSSLDAAVLLNDEEVDEGHSAGVSPTQGGLPYESKSSSGVGAAAPSAAPEATQPPLTRGMSSGGMSCAAVGDAIEPASSGDGVEATAPACRTAAEAQRISGSCERFHEPVRETAAAEEEALLPSSTFLQLLPDLLHGLVEAGAALPYSASAAPFPPVLLEVRWKQKPSSLPEAGSKVEEAMSLLESCSASSNPAVIPQEAAEMLPRASDEGGLFGSLPIDLPASRSAQATRRSAAKVEDAAATHEDAQTTAPHALQRRASRASSGVSSSEGFTPAPVVDGCSLPTDVLFSTTHPAAAAQERRTPGAVSPAAAESSASLGSTTAAPAAVATENSTVPGCSPPAAVPSSKRMLLAPAGLLQQLRTHSSAAVGLTLEQPAGGPDVNSGKREGSICSARRAVTAEGNSRNCTSYAAECTDSEGAAFTEKRTAKEGCAVRLAVQEQLFNFIYYHLQDAVRGGPLADDFWRRGNCMRWEGKDWGNAGSACCSSRDDSNRRRASSNRINVGKDVETQWLDCVEQCVLETIYTQVQLLCMSLCKYSTSINQQNWGDSSLRADGTAQPAGFTANSSAKTPAGAAYVTFSERAAQVLQQGDLQVEQQQNQEAETQREQHCEQQLTQLEKDLREVRAHRQDVDKLSLEGDPYCHAKEAADCALPASPAAADVAAVAHMLLQLAGDLALLADINESALRDDCPSTCLGCCSAERGKGLNKAETEAVETSAAEPRQTHASNVESGSVALRTAATAATARAEASASTPVAALRRGRATIEVRPAAEIESSLTAAAGGNELVTAGASLSLTGPDTVLNRGLVSNDCRHSSCNIHSKEETKRNSGCTCRLLRWWVKDEKCSPRNTPCKTVVIEVGACAGGNYSRGSSASVARAFPLCHLSALSGACTPQEQIEGITAFEPVLRYANHLQQQQSHERKQNAQQRETSQRTRQPPNSRETLGGKHVTKAEEKEVVVAFKLRDQAKGSPSYNDKVGPMRDTATGAERTEAARCWLSLLGQLEQDENISLLFL